MYYRLFILGLLIMVSHPAAAAVDIALRGRDPVRIEDVYQQRGIPYIAVEDALGAVGLTGHWDSISHKFRIKTAQGWAEISPASHYLKLQNNYYQLREKPRFIDGRLRVTDSFILDQLAQLTGRPIYFLNLHPETDNAAGTEPRGLEKFFAFFLNKKAPRNGSLIRAVAIDPGHGGLDTGVLAADGTKEKDLTLEIAEKLAKKLKMRLGIPVYLSRDGDYELTTEQRLQTASAQDVDLWILLHAQSAFSPSINGVSLFIRPEKPPPWSSETDAPAEATAGSLRLARGLVSALRKNEIEVQGVFPSSRLSLGQGDLPTVQLELGYLSHEEDLKNLKNPDYQDQIVESLYAGIRDFARQTKEKVDDVPRPAKN